MNVNHSFHLTAVTVREVDAHSPCNSKCLEYNLSSVHHFLSFLAYEHHNFKENDLIVKSQIVAKPDH